LAAIMMGRENAADLELAKACARHEIPAIERLVREFFPKLETHVRYIMGDAASEAMDGVRDRVFPPPTGVHNAIDGYSGKSSLDRWLRVVATREALRWQRRSSARTRREGIFSHRDVIGTDPLSDLLYARYRPVLQEVLDAALTELPPDKRHIMKAHFYDGATMDALGKIHGYDKSTISRWLDQAKRDLVRRCKDRLKQDLALADSSIESFIETFYAQLKVEL
jgi:RNA polymerase sigma-70 factor, ECF subfamily